MTGEKLKSTALHRGLDVVGDQNVDFSTTYVWGDFTELRVERLQLVINSKNLHDSEHPPSQSGEGTITIKIIHIF